MHAGGGGGGGEKKENRGHMTVLFHNKGIVMIDLPQIIHYKSGRKAVPGLLNELMNLLNASSCCWI